MSDWAADLITFFKARLDEIEAAAKAAQSPSPWKAATHEADSWIVTDATGEPLIFDEGTPSLEEAAHIARHDPARTLREVEVKRKLIAEYEDCHNTGNSPDHYDGYWDAIVRFAAVDRDHPDFRQEWPV